MNAYFVASVLVLAVLLFFPVSRVVWVLSVRRLQRRQGRSLSEAEAQGQLNRARLIAVVLVLAFSYLFNLSLGKTLGYG
jgi:hypothetical protein